jgi:hypothetical protein
MVGEARKPHENLPGHAVKRDGYVEIHIDEGLVCSKAQEECVEAIKATAAHFHSNRLMLVCEDHDNVNSIADAYRIGTKVAEEGKGMRLCVVLRGRSIQSLDRFVEMVAANRGGSIRYFEDYDEARRWIKTA